MNKQEIKEQIILTVKEAIGNNIYFVQNDDRWDECDAVIDVNSVDHIAEQSADELIEAGYINGADFVEWLKHKTLDPICRAKMENFMFDSLLQEYLKGE